MHLYLFLLSVIFTNDSELMSQYFFIAKEKKTQQINIIRIIGSLAADDLL